MIKITSQEHIQTKDDFEVDKIGLVNFVFRGPTKRGEKHTLSFDVRPFAYMDDGSRFYDMDPDAKQEVKLFDVEEYIKNGNDPTFNSAYFATEAAIANLLSLKTPLTCEFEAPQS